MNVFCAVASRLTDLRCRADGVQSPISAGSHAERAKIQRNVSHFLCLILFVVFDFDKPTIFVLYCLRGFRLYLSTLLLTTG